MRGRITFAAAAALLFAVALVRIEAQAGAGQPPAQGGRGQGAPAAGQGGGRGRGPATFPAQQRPPGDSALIARGRALYDVNCRSCHGADLRGGDMGGPNLLRSQIALNDQKGELILPVIKGSLPRMPPVPLSDADVAAVAEYVHSVIATMRGQGSPPAGAPAVLNIVVGDAAAGKAYVAKVCTGCHAAGFAGIAARIPEPMALQTYWVAGGGGGGGRGGRGGAAPAGPPPAPTVAVVTLPSGQKFEGPLVRYDDFVVALTTSDGASRSFRRDGDVPKVEIRDPRDAHRKLWPTLSDKDMHDVTAYLVTLK
jgi:cytochrome c oxidase cbb3-type subunit 3